MRSDNKPKKEWLVGVEWWNGEGSGVNRVGKGGHQLALKILNRRHMYNFGPDTILPDSSTVIIQKYFLNNLLLHKLSQSSQLQ